MYTNQKTNKTMDKTLGKEIPALQRGTYLNDNCDAIVAMGYMKRLGPEKIQEMKDELSEAAIQINDIDDEKKAIIEKFKEELKPLNEQRKLLLKGLKQKAEFVENETCYKFAFPEEKMVGFYNREGDLVDFRPMTGDEMQPTIFQVARKTGTDS